MRALIVEDGSSRGALAAVRALARAGWTVSIGSPIGSLAASSRDAASWHPVPPAAAGLEPFVAGVAATIGRTGAEVVFGAGDAEVLALSLRRSELGAVVPYAPHDVVVRALDKLSLIEAAREAGFAVPRTVPATEAELAALEGPAIVKARLHSLPGAESAPGRQEALLCREPAAAAARSASIRAGGGEPLLQEVAAGELTAFTALVGTDARLVAAVQQVAEGTWPPETGASVRARTVPVEDELARKAGALFRGLGWLGLAELQLLTPTDGDPLLIDLNGRFYGSLALATGAGLNLPAMWAALATGRPLPEGREARVGVRYQWLEGDLRRALEERRGGLLRDVGGSLVYAVGAAHSVSSARDPRPAVRAAARILRGIVR